MSSSVSRSVSSSPDDLPERNALGGCPYCGTTQLQYHVWGCPRYEEVEYMPKIDSEYLRWISERRGEKVEDEIEVRIVTNGIAYILAAPEGETETIDVPLEDVARYRRAAIRAISDLDTWRARQSRGRAVREGVVPVG